jgi:hypothetical protein
MCHNSSQWHHTLPLTQIIVAQMELPHNCPPSLYSWLHLCNLKGNKGKRATTLVIPRRRCSHLHGQEILPPFIGSLPCSLTRTHQWHPIIMNPVRSLWTSFKFYFNNIFSSTPRSAKRYLQFKLFCIHSPSPIPNWPAKLNLLMYWLHSTNYELLISNFFILPLVTFS